MLDVRHRVHPLSMGTTVHLVGGGNTELVPTSLESGYSSGISAQKPGRNLESKHRALPCPTGQRHRHFVCFYPDPSSPPCFIE
jgi:hypothetical protein